MAYRELTQDEERRRVKYVRMIARLGLTPGQLQSRLNRRHTTLSDWAAGRTPVDELAMHVLACLLNH